jgi:hypothetical protein
MDRELTEVVRECTFGDDRPDPRECADTPVAVPLPLMPSQERGYDPGIFHTAFLDFVLTIYQVHDGRINIQWGRVLRRIVRYFQDSCAIGLHRRYSHPLWPCGEL